MEESRIVVVTGAAGGIGSALCRRFLKDGVVTPGLTVTDAARKTFGTAMEAGRMRRAIQSDLKPQDIVGAVAFLASDDAALMTGQIVNVDGGTNMH